MQQWVVVADIGLAVPSFHQSLSDRGTYLFLVQMSFRTTRWFVQKNYSQFRDLRSKLSQKYHNLPDFPEWKFSLRLTQEDLEQRREGLQIFLQSIIVRKDLFNSPHVAEFLMFNTYCKELLLSHPILHSQILLDDDRGLRDCIYFQDLNCYITATGDFNPVSRAGAYLTNMKLPWEEDLPTLIPVGSVDCWGWSEKNKTFKMFWSKIYKSQAFCLCIQDSDIFVGLEEGVIDWVQSKPQNKFKGLKEIMQIRIHEEKVAALAIDKSRKLLLSASQDRKLMVFDYENRYKVNETEHDQPLTAMAYDSQGQRIFVGNYSGQVLIYSLKTYQPQRQKVLCTVRNGEVSSLVFDSKRYYLFASEKETGHITIFQVQQSGKQKLAKKVSGIEGKQGCSCVAWMNGRMQVAVGHQDGTLIIYNSRSQPLCINLTRQSDN